MEEKLNFYKLVEEICNQDKRYKPDAYEFVADALHYTQKKLKRYGHVSGVELLKGIREFALKEYGPMARNVLTHWGISKTEDFGNIVFNLIKKKLFSKNESDSLDDFKAVYDFQTAFKHEVRDIAI
jgi:uncharacterized repeat protein (TIGR04138 family)